MKIKVCRSILLALLIGLVAACGGGGGDGGFSPTPLSAGGFWQGTTTADGVTQNILGFVSESKLFHFVREDKAEFFGTLTINGKTATASFTGVPAANSTFADGSTQGTGTLTATIQSRVQLSVTATFTTQNSTTSNITMTVQYDAGYDPDSSLATVDGNFTNTTSPGSDVFTINSGVVTYSDNTGCMANGTVTLIDSRYNLYNVQFTFAGCPVPQQNGLQLQGLLAIDLTSNPNLLLMAMHGTSQGAPIAFLFAYQRA